MPDNRFFEQASSLSLAEIINFAGGTVTLNDASYGNIVICSVSPLELAQKGDITFLSNPKYKEFLTKTKASACILNKKFASLAPKNLPLLICDNPYAAYAKIAIKFYPNSSSAEDYWQFSEKAGIHKTVKIGTNCKIGEGVFIGENAEIGDNTYVASGSYIGKGVKIGNNCKLLYGVVVTHAIIGNEVILYTGVKIGQDGFGYAFDAGNYIKVPQLGRVIIGNKVEIGANSCIDRGAGPDTIIGDETKIDNLVQIGHNVQIGRACIIVAQTGIAGSTKIGNYTVIGGQVGIAGHLHIGDKVNIAAQSGIVKDIKDNEVVGGYPAIPIKQWHRQTIALKKLIKNYIT